MLNSVEHEKSFLTLGPDCHMRQNMQQLCIMQEEHATVAHYAYVTSKGSDQSAHPCSLILPLMFYYIQYGH